MNARLVRSLTYISALLLLGLGWAPVTAQEGMVKSTYCEVVESGLDTPCDNEDRSMLPLPCVDVRPWPPGAGIGCLPVLEDGVGPLTANATVLGNGTWGISIVIEELPPIFEGLNVSYGGNASNPLGQQSELSLPIPEDTPLVIGGFDGPRVHPDGR